MARSPKGPGLVWIGVVCFGPGCDVPGGRFLLGSTRDRGSVRVRLQSRAGRPVAAGAHASRLGPHGGGPYPPGAHRPRGLPKPGVPARHSLTSGRCPPRTRGAYGTLLRLFASRLCCCCCAQRRRECPFDRERARRLRAGCIAGEGSQEASVEASRFLPEAPSRGGDMRRMILEAPVPVVLVCSSPARAGTSAGAAVGPIVGCGWSTVVPGVAGLVKATAGLCSPCIGTAVAGGASCCAWRWSFRRADARICICWPTPL